MWHLCGNILFNSKMSTLFHTNVRKHCLHACRIFHVWLLNPCKPEIGKISKQILAKINATIREKTNLNQWRNTNSVINWFQKIKNKNELRFIQFDVVEFNPSITKELLTDALSWAKEFLDISDEEIEIILQAKKSLLYNGTTPWSKKGNLMFDVAMGSFDGAETWTHRTIPAERLG